MAFKRKTGPEDEARIKRWKATVPRAMQRMPQWVTWMSTKRRGKMTKIPYTPGTMDWASTTDHETWGTFEEALEASYSMSGIGIVLTPELSLVGIDLDHVLVADKLHTQVRNVLEYLDSYTEISPSGTGLRIFVLAKKHTARCKTNWPTSEMGFEAYDGGRFLTVTGNVYVRKRKLRRCNRDLNELLNKILGYEEPRPPAEIDGEPWGAPWDGSLPDGLQTVFAMRGGSTQSLHFYQLMTKTVDELVKLKRYRGFDMSESGVEMAAATVMLKHLHMSQENTVRALKWRRVEIGAKQKHPAYYRKTLENALRT